MGVDSLMKLFSIFTESCYNELVITENELMFASPRDIPWACLVLNTMRSYRLHGASVHMTG